MYRSYVNFFVGIGHSNKLQYWKSITFKRPVGIINVCFMILKLFLLIVEQLHARKCTKLSKWHVFATWKQVLSLYNADIGCNSVNTQYIDIQEIYWNKTLKKSRNNQISKRYPTRNKNINFEMRNKFTSKNILPTCNWFLYVTMLHVYSYVDKRLYIPRYIFHAC